MLKIDLNYRDVTAKGKEPITNHVKFICLTNNQDQAFRWLERYFSQFGPLDHYRFYFNDRVKYTSYLSPYADPTAIPGLFLVIRDGRSIASGRKKK